MASTRKFDGQFLCYNFLKVIDPTNNEIEIIIVQRISDKQEGVIDQERPNKCADQWMILFIVNIIAFFQYH